MENKQVNKKSDNSKVILIVVILILLGVIGYLVFTNSEKDNTIATQTEKINADSLEKARTLKEYQDLQLHYQKLKEENQALGLETASLDSTIQALNVSITKIRSSNASEVKKWKGKLEALQNQFDQVKTDLESKIRENETLSLKLDSMRLNDQRLADSINNLTAVKAELAHQVAIASVLRAENIKTASVNSKGKETEGSEFKSKSLAKLKVSFNLAENEVAKKESKDIYMRVTEPGGSVLFDGDKIFTLDGKETFYTEKRTINFDNSRQEVVFVYEKGSEYKPGSYTIQFYAEGRKIGETALTVK